MAEEVYFVESQRGGVHLLADGYHYRYDRKLSDGITQSFRCTEKLCRGRMFKNGDDLKLKHKHDHNPDMIEMNVRRAMIAIKERARTTNELAETIIEQQRATLPAEVNERLPQDAQLIRTIDRLRSSNNNNNKSNNGDQYLTEIVTLPESVNYICVDAGQQQQQITDLNGLPVEQHFVCEFSSDEQNQMTEKKRRKLELQKIIEMNRQANENNRLRRSRFS
ncbi:hypothetical protein BLA29_011012, partial [Euroglyphus maynei]